MRARRNLTCIAKRRYTAMPKSVDPAASPYVGDRLRLSRWQRLRLVAPRPRFQSVSPSPVEAEIASLEEAPKIITLHPATLDQYAETVDALAASLAGHAEARDDRGTVGEEFPCARSQRDRPSERPA